MSPIRTVVARSLFPSRLLMPVVYATWLVLVTGVAITADLGRIGTRFSDWPGRVVSILKRAV